MGTVHLLLPGSVSAALLLVLAPPADFSSGPRTGVPPRASVCAECHPSESELLRDSPHLALLAERSEVDACQACHGNCSDHVQSADPEDVARSLAYATADELTAACSACHARAIESVHHWAKSDHKQLGKSCSDCHAVHQRKSRTPQLQDERRFLSLTDLNEGASFAGGEKCVECHPTKALELRSSHHAMLAPSAEKEEGERDPAHAHACETCHGAGSLHVEGLGTRRHVIRPDLAEREGTRICRSCHPDVHPFRFHWPDRERQLGRQITCGTCHRIHWDKRRGNRAGLWIEQVLGGERR